MKVTFIWLTMGPYHIARMNAIATLLGKESLNVIEICSKDDHQWNLNHLDKNFNYFCCLPKEVLSKQSLKKAKSILLNQLQNLDSDIIVNGCGYFDFTMYSIFKKISKSKAKILLWSETTFADNPNPWYKIVLKKWLTRKYDGALVAGIAHKEMLQKIGFKSKSIQIVGNVVDNSVFQSNFSSIAEKKGYVFVGRFLSIKNISRLILAYKKLVERGEDWDLHLIGDGPERKKNEKLSLDLGLTKRVHFLGSLQQNELIKAYQKYAIFILPSSSEPWGLVVNEAMASGLPVIVSSHCGSAELIQDGKNGFLINPYKIDELANKMELLKNNTSLQMQFSEEGLVTISYFTPQNYAQKAVSFFKEILK